MIIRQDKRGSRLSPKIVVYLLAALLGLGAVFFILRARTTSQGATYAFCGMEETREEGEKTYFVVDGRDFSHGQTQSDAEAKSGRYSCLLFEAAPFGPTWETAEVQPGEIYEAKIWRKTAVDAGLFIASGDWGLYQRSLITGKRAAGGWEELELRIEVPKYIKSGTLKIYPYNPRPEPAYFDDMSVRKVGQEKIASTSVPSYGASDSIRTLNLILGEKGEKKLRDKRDQALRKGLLISGDNDWVKCKIEEGKAQYRGKLRLKGDWPDHLRGEKWSYRISLATGQAWNRLITFSIQSPTTRYMLYEYIYHRWLEREDVLTPRYDFINVKVNNINKGIFAWEEHFMKQIPEYNQRREGPILKFVEDGFWDVQEKIIAKRGLHLEERVPIFRSSNIEAFGMGRTLKDSALFQQYQIAQNLMYEYKTQQKSIWDVFDVERMARYFAIVDVARSHHGFIWHNQRLYYNPVISKLEPIGFDGYTYSGPYEWLPRPFLGHSRNFRYMQPGYKEAIFERFFHDEAFVAMYVRYLDQFTREDYLDQLFAEIGADVDQREAWLQKEWPTYSYPRYFLYKQAAKLRTLMYPMRETSLKAHLQGQGAAGGYRYKVFNYHNLPVIPLGVGKRKGVVTAKFDRDTLLGAYANEFPAEFLDLNAAETGKWVMFRIPGLDSIFSVELLNWPVPEAFTPEQELFSDLRLANDHIYELDEVNKQVRFRTGKYQTDRDILIPPGYEVWFEPGVELDLIKKAKFISKSYVLIFGTEERPVIIQSSDQSANGFTILQAKRKSEFNYAVFDNLNTLAYKGWNLTGAVTLYESEAYIKNCRFVNNHCEDALNLVRCVFTMENSYVGYTFADGFDADFCNGRVNNCFFYKTGNDGMDFSGSTMTITDCEVDQAGDKGISLGEESTVTVKSAKISNSVMGLVAKDLTSVKVDFVELYGNQTAFAAYQKKPEYGPATITVKKSKLEGNEEMYLLQQGSELKIGDKVIKGKR
ncbi:MAG: right-handed parallel beta-helix repeat-containing protein [Bacteroidota bacterium]